MYSKHDFAIQIQFGFLSVFRLTAISELKTAVCCLSGFIVSAFRVIGQNLLFETVQSRPLSFCLMFSLLFRELTNIFLFVTPAAGVAVCDGP